MTRQYLSQPTGIDSAPGQHEGYRGERKRNPRSRGYPDLSSCSPDRRTEGRKPQTFCTKADLTERVDHG
jgi:hypothetical protein